ncbi:MAG: tetratricopeptide repeat protein [Deltaproteobacteria bacterium]|nr:tetratricopeptide repeat protein [Deltaproteobacteria bacterium]
MMAKPVDSTLTASAFGGPRRVHLFIFSLFLVGVSGLSGACGGLPVSAPAMRHNADGAELLARGDLDGAEARFRLALELRPGFAEARANLGIVAVERGDLVGAQVSIEQALDADRDFALGWSGLGVVRERRGDAEGAMEAYGEALAIDPTLPTPRRNLAFLLAREGRHREARAHLLRLLVVDAEDPEAAAVLGWCELRLGRIRAALDRATAVLARWPRHPRALLVRGAARARLGDLEHALDDLEGAARARELRTDALTYALAVATLAGDDSRAQQIQANLDGPRRERPSSEASPARDVPGTPRTALASH